VPDDLDMSRVRTALAARYEGPAAEAWLVDLNPLLGDQRPIDLVRAGRTGEVLEAIRAELGESHA
jgi:hypothetical protein